MGSTSERLITTLAKQRAWTHLVTLDHERVRVEARVLEWLPFVFTPTLGIHMGFHVAETRRSVRVGSHSSRSVGENCYKTFLMSTAAHGASSLI